MLDRLDDTIVAVSSAPGWAPLGIVRLSGPDALTIAAFTGSTVDGRALTTLPGWVRAPGLFFIDEQRSAPAVFYVFRAPHSYTRQDVVEVHTVGSSALLAIVRRRLIEGGARAAEPGEFTARAYLHGAMDLASAEAVAAVIRAESDTQLRAARRMMDGELSRRISGLREELADLLALVEAGIDFAEEPIEFVSPRELDRRLRGVAETLDALRRSAEPVERFDTFPHILLFGAPNAGKSSLMNCLSGMDRAICAAAAGTTRDILSAPIRLARGEAILLDAAGVDSSDDPVVAAARAMAVSAAERVDLVCLVVDLTAPLDEGVVRRLLRLSPVRLLVAANKCDLLPPSRALAVTKEIESRNLGPVFPVSALRGDGVEALRRAMADLVGTAEATTVGEAVLLSERQRAAVAESLDATLRAKALAEEAQGAGAVDRGDLIAFELREALDALVLVTGDVTTEDLLTRVFSRFCIGK